MSYSDDVYFFQQCFVFLLWLWLLRIAGAELRALWMEGKKEKKGKKREEALPQGLKRGVRVSCGKKPEAFARVSAPALLRLEADASRRIRIKPGKSWSGVGIS